MGKKKGAKVSENREMLEERRMSLTNLLNIYYRRLSHAEEKKATFGLNTPFEVEEDIRQARMEIKQFITELDTINEKLGSEMTKSDETALVEIRLPGNLENVTPEQREAAIKAAVGALAGVLGVPMEEILAKYLGAGSVWLRLRLPKAAAERLVEMYKREDPALAYFELEAVRLVNREEQRGIARESARAESETNLALFDLSKSLLRNLNLRKVNLSQTNLSRVDLSGADLSGADLSGANLYRANLRGANLRHARYRKTLTIRAESNDESKNIAPQRANLSRANLREADLSYANLRGANFSGANLSRANLTAVDLHQADLHKTNLNEVNLNGANLIGANLIGANLIGANLNNADLSGAILDGAFLERVNLSGTDLRGVNLHNVATFFGITFDRFTRWPENFDPEARGRN
ncbi:MAG: pentapeptide repeat-containing protein [Anaerolineaceae bacterium]|nr:pentapeptide repeat-containing protein [Anaerolineaceae bacterium]